MIKKLAIFCVMLTALFSFSGEAKTKKSKKSRSGKTSHHYKPSKHAHKSRRFRHHGNGPDLKAITTESPYKEVPSNGVTPVETKQ